MPTKYDTEDDWEYVGRYAAFDDEAGKLVIYDVENETEWVKSDETVELAEML